MLVACAQATFYPYEGRDNVHLGDGGSRFVVSGIDVWFNGKPPRKYAIIGYIEDAYSLGPDPNHKTISADVLKKAQEIKADALIEVVTLTNQGSSPAVGIGFGSGSRGSGMGVGFGFGGGYQDASVGVKYTALKYLD